MGGFYDYYRRLVRPGMSATPGTTTIRVAQSRKRLVRAADRKRMVVAQDR